MTSNLVTFQTIYSSLTFTTYVVAEDQQHFGIVRVVCDLHQRDEGQVPVGETFSKVVRDKDPRPVTSGHVTGQDHL